jgi:transposase
MPLNPHPLARLLKKAKGDANKARPRNGTDALLLRAEQVLALLDDLSLPFSNNQAERDLRWAKGQQKAVAPFAVRLVPQPFAASAATLLPCRSRGIPCCLL